jgi:CdiI immunity protein
MVLTRNDYNELRNFIACSFHPDWDETAKTYQAVVDVALSTYDMPTAQEIAREVEALLASPITNDELAKWLEVIGCYVILEGENYTARTFITMIGDRIRALRG